MKRFAYELVEAFRIALAQIRANAMRSALTALGVIIGILAVTLMGTAINGIGETVNQSLAGFGDDVYFIGKWPWLGGQDFWVYRNRRNILPILADQINSYIGTTPNTALKLAVPVAQTSSTIVRGLSKMENIWTLGTTADYSKITKTEIKDGRFFSEFEVQSGRNVVMIGYDVADALFPNESPIGKQIRIKDGIFEVIGVVSRQGSFLGTWSWDAMVALPLPAYRQYFSHKDDVEIRVQFDKTREADAKDELEGLMRRLRGVSPEARDDFEINSQATLGDTLGKMQFYIALGGLLITGLALLVGSVGIMNITYVSVKERTKEIGTRKALGARRSTILLQFLIEAVSICLIGGLAGLLLTASIARGVGAAFPQFPLVFSFGLIVIGLLVSTGVGILSGILPAIGASKLDPVVALRYE